MSISNEKYEQIRGLPISEVAGKWGIDLYWQGKEASFYCPNPKHNDTHLGNCRLTEEGDKNLFYCFACNVGGGPIELVSLIDGLDKAEAAQKIGIAFDILKQSDVDQEPKIIKGLRLKDYNKYFGLSKAYIKSDIDKKYRSYSIRDLKYNDREMHDFIVTCKFEEKYNAYARVLDDIRNGCFLQLGEIFMPSNEWVDIITDKQLKLSKAYVKALE